MMASRMQRSMDVSLCMAGLEKGVGLYFWTFFFILFQLSCHEDNRLKQKEF